MMVGLGWLRTITRPGILGYLKSNEKKCCRINFSLLNLILY